MGLARGQTDDEWRGCAAGCGEETNLVSVQIADARDDLKLYRPGEYPVIRGMALQIGERHALLWRSGYVPRLDTYTGPETRTRSASEALRRRSLGTNSNR
jgi:hypothetical protein